MSWWATRRVPEVSSDVSEEGIPRHVSNAGYKRPGKAPAAPFGRGPHPRAAVLAPWGGDGSCRRTICVVPSELFRGRGARFVVRNVVMKSRTRGTAAASTRTRRRGRRACSAAPGPRGRRTHLPGPHTMAARRGHLAARIAAGRVRASRDAYGYGFVEGAYEASAFASSSSAELDF